MKIQSVSNALLVTAIALAATGCSKSEAPGSVDDQVNALIKKEQQETAKKLEEAPIITPHEEPEVIANVIPEVSVKASACANPVKLQITGAFDQGEYDEDHKPTNVLDNDFSPESRWSAEGQGKWLMFDLGMPAVINNLEIAFYKGDARQAFYEVETSTDSEQWVKVLESGTSSGNTLGMQTIEIAKTDGRYVRIIGNGTTQNAWSAYTEVAVYGCPL